MAQAMREESVLQQFYTKEIMPSRPLDIISACHIVYEGRGSRSINGSTFTKQFKQEAQWHGDNGSDRQALIKATENQCLYAGHYILDEIHNAAEKLQAKQDGLFNWEEQAQLTREGEAW